VRVLCVRVCVMCVLLPSSCAGQLVPDELIVAMVRTRLESPECLSRGWVLDGFPRTAEQVCVCMCVCVHKYF
jgi:hypothetical protein